MHLVGFSDAVMPLPLAPASFALADNQEVDAYGYGCTSISYNKAALKKGSYTKYSCTTSASLRSTKPGSYVQESDCTIALDWCLRNAGQSEIENGDSGGPWVTDLSNPFIVGVTSFNSAPKVTSPTAVDWQAHAAARATDPAVHSWLTSTAGIVNAHPAIFRNPANGASWEFGTDGFRHSIPDGGTYLCLTASGLAVYNLDSFTLAEMPLSPNNATCSAGPNLIANGSFESDNFGDYTLDLGGTAPLTGWDTNANGTYPWGLSNNNSLGAGPAADGNQWVVVGNYYNGGTWVEQTLTGLTVGETYTVSFATASEEPNGGGQALVQVSFPAGSDTLAQTFQAPPTKVNYWDTWATNALNFVANSSSVTVRFEGLAGPGGDPGVDNVSVTR